MTSRKDNDTSVWSKVEREQTVATYEGSSGRSSEWRDSNEVDAQPSVMFPVRGD